MNHLTKTTTSLTGLSLAAAMILGAPQAVAEPQTYVVDDEHFSMTFEVQHIGYAPVMGMFLDVEGQFKFDEQTNALTSGSLTFDSDSVFTNHKKRDGHLKSADFLNSGEYPDITFTVTDFESTGQTTGTVTGDLTLLGQTRPVDVDITLNKSAEYPIGHEDYTLGMSAETVIKRSEWGMTYGVGNDLVGDEVTLRFGFEAIRESGWLD